MARTTITMEDLNPDAKLYLDSLLDMYAAVNHYLDNASLNARSDNSIEYERMCFLRDKLTDTLGGEIIKCNLDPEVLKYMSERLQ